MDYFITVKFEDNTLGYCFSCQDNTLKVGDFVVCDTTRGLEIGKISKEPQEMSKYKLKFELKPILKKADEGDIKLYKLNKIKAAEYGKIFMEEEKKLNLGMKLLSTELMLDQSKVVFSYVSDQRVDFRDLLKNLIVKIKCKIELRQVAARDRAQKIGGIGPCGLITCCSLFLREFEGITTSMIKNQMLSGNTSKLSGLCDKLLCCLKFENEGYSQAKKDFPPLKSEVYVEGVKYLVAGYNVFSKVIKLKNNLEGELYLPLNEVKTLIKKQAKLEKKDKTNNNDEK